MEKNLYIDASHPNETRIVLKSNNAIEEYEFENKNNLISVKNSKEFSNLTNFLISKISSPYEEIKYTIKNNDTIEKILKKNNINFEDISNISTKLKLKKLLSINEL